MPALYTRQSVTPFHITETPALTTQQSVTLFHVTETPALTTQPSATFSNLPCHSVFHNDILHLIMSFYIPSYLSVFHHVLDIPWHHSAHPRDIIHCIISFCTPLCKFAFYAGDNHVILHFTTSFCMSS